MNAEVIDLFKTVSKIIELPTRIHQPKIKQDKTDHFYFQALVT
jgi:hypothetical protein